MKTSFTKQKPIVICGHLMTSVVDCKKVILGMGKGGFEASSMLSVRTCG